MGWQDAPVVETKKASWQDAPVVGKPDPVKEAIDRSPTAGLVDAGLSLASGAVAAPVAGLAGVAGTLLPGPKEQGANWVRKTQDALTVEPKTPIGKGLVKAVSYPFEKLADVGDKIGEKTAEGTGSPAAGAGLNTAFQALPLIVGRAGPAGGVEASTARANALRLKNAPADGATTGAKEAGYVLPPSQANPSIWNKIMEGFGGKIKTAQDASLKNQPVTNSLVKQGLGLTEDAPLSPTTLAGVRKEAGQAYERVRSAGTVTADPAYSQALDSIAAPFERAAKDFPDAARSDVLDAVKAARRESFDASSAVDQIGILRDKADTAYAAKDKKLGKAYKGIAGALEEQLARHVETMSQGNEYGAKQFSPQDVEAFRNARQLIAKSYTVEKHLGADGNVNAQGLAADLKRGRPLSGEIKTAAEFGENFPRAAQLPSKVGGVPASPLDHAFAISSALGGVASGHPTLALAGLAPYARPLIRKLMTSGGYQNTFVNPQTYGPSTMSRLQQLQSLPSVQALEMAEGQRQ